MAKHKHADLIHAYAEGAEMQYLKDGVGWVNLNFFPSWSHYSEYRVKPQPKPDYVLYDSVSPSSIGHHLTSPANVRFTFDGETGALKSAEVLK